MSDTEKDQTEHMQQMLDIEDLEWSLVNQFSMLKIGKIYV